MTPQWLKLTKSSGEQLLKHMRSYGFHAYLLFDNYDVDAAMTRAQPIPPRRLRDGEKLDAYKQVDVIFSRRDVHAL